MIVQDRIREIENQKQLIRGQLFNSLDVDVYKQLILLKADRNKIGFCQVLKPQGFTLWECVRIFDLF